MTAELWPAIWAELLKVRRSKLSWISVLAFTIAPAVGGLFMFVLQDPSRAASFGLIAGKAQFSGATGDWPGHFALLGQMVSIAGLLVFGMIVIWMFGREFSDRTAKDLLALPTARESIVLAKFAVALVWCLLLTVQLCVLGFVFGAALGLSGWSAAVAMSGFSRILVAAFLTVLLVTPFGFAAGLGRGYLAAVGVMFATLALAQVIAALGHGAYFPWAVPALLTQIAAETQEAPGAIGYALVVAVGVAGVLGTAFWWRRADHTR
ncbi:ABC transporter permease [Thermopolyspora sp. NPDC052614]|uniref:ABC transporter permease n=1 Tax=Thermopolyspora sp. NPDC052614 TaxID=3155682 RepID=UPI003424A8B9